MIEDRYLIATLMCRSIKSFVILLQHPANASTLALRYANAWIISSLRTLMEFTVHSSERARRIFSLHRVYHLCLSYTLAGLLYPLVVRNLHVWALFRIAYLSVRLTQQRPPSQLSEHLGAITKPIGIGKYPRRLQRQDCWPGVGWGGAGYRRGSRGSGVCKRLGLE